MLNTSLIQGISAKYVGGYPVTIYKFLNPILCSSFENVCPHTLSFKSKSIYICAFADSEIENFLAIDGQKESVILFVGAGHGTGQAVPEKMLLQLK